jgi:hypothetical protein
MWNGAIFHVPYNKGFNKDLCNSSQVHGPRSYYWIYFLSLVTQKSLKFRTFDQASPPEGCDCPCTMTNALKRWRRCCTFHRRENITLNAATMSGAWGSPIRPPLPKFWGYLCLYQNFKVTPFVENKGNDNPFIYGTRVIFYHPLWGIFQRNQPPYVRTIFKKLTPSLPIYLERTWPWRQVFSMSMWIFDSHLHYST